MKGTFTENVMAGVAIPPQELDDGGTLDGLTIHDPASKGRLLSFLLMAALLGTPTALTGTTVLTVVVQGSVDNGTTWNTMKEKDGITDLEFTASKTIAAGELDPAVGGMVVGTLDLTRFVSGGAASGINAIRLAVTVNTGADIAISAAYTITELYYHPDTDRTDDFLTKQIPLP